MPGSAVTTRKHQPGSILAREPLSESSRSAKSCSAPSGFFFLPPWPSTCARRDLDEEGAQSIFYGRAARRLHVHRAIIAETGRGNFWQSGRSVSRGVDRQVASHPPAPEIYFCEIETDLQAASTASDPAHLSQKTERSSQTRLCVHFLCS